jgi:hypothetical protein
MGSVTSSHADDTATNLEGDPGHVDNPMQSSGHVDNPMQSVMYRQGTYMPSNNKSGKYSATVVVTPSYVLFTIKLPPYILPATAYGKASDLLNPYHRWVLNSETLKGACGQYEFKRVVYFKGDRLVFSDKQKGIKMDYGKNFHVERDWVLVKV